MTPIRSIAYFLTLLVVGTLPGVASAQPWRDAYQAGEYAKAANLLPEIVSDQEKMVRGANWILAPVTCVATPVKKSK